MAIFADMEERIPITCRVSIDTAIAILELAHGSFNDSIGEAIGFLVREHRSHSQSPSGSPRQPSTGRVVVERDLPLGEHVALAGLQPHHVYLREALLEFLK